MERHFRRIHSRNSLFSVHSRGLWSPFFLLRPAISRLCGLSTTICMIIIFCGNLEGAHQGTVCQSPCHSLHICIVLDYSFHRHQAVQLLVILVARPLIECHPLNDLTLLRERQRTSITSCLKSSSFVSFGFPTATLFPLLTAVLIAIEHSSRSL